MPAEFLHRKASTGYYRPPPSVGYISYKIVYTIYSMYLVYFVYIVYTVYMTLQEQMKRVEELLREHEAEAINRMPKYRNVGSHKYVVHPQADGSEKVFDMLTGKEIIEGEIV